MGKYINTINGVQVPNKNKAQFILDHIPGSSLIPPPTEFQEGLVCVVDNGPFEAAGYAYSEGEMRVFLSQDSGVQRPQQWLVVPDAEKYTL
jgi:hypothetical protein